MIRQFATSGQALVPAEAGAEAVWTDLLSPEPAELAAAAAELGIGLPSREEMEEIELSSRLYMEHGAAYMTALLPAQTDTDSPHVGPVTFILAGERLVTLRYHNPKTFDFYPTRAQRSALGCASAEAVLLGLFEEMIDRLADVLERAGREIDALARSVFRPGNGPQAKSRDFKKLLEEIGRKQDLVTKLRECLLTLERVLGFLGQAVQQRGAPGTVRDAVRIQGRDVHSLLEHAGFLGQQVSFVLEATLGLINIEQNSIIKIFSVAAVMFLPPTLIASIYGMNFDEMPELRQIWGYPAALAAMVVSAVLPYLYFRRRGWL